MTGLTAVSPDRRGVVNGKGPGREVGGTGGNGEEAGIEPDLGTSGVGQGHARGVKRRLGDGVVLDLEGELDGLARSSGDTAGSEREISVGATNNNFNGASGGSGRARRRRGAGVGIGHRAGGRVPGTSLELGADRESGVLEVGEGVGGSVSTAVDGVDHPAGNNRQE